MLICLIFILNFVIRIIPRLYLKDLLLSDTYYHLFVAKKIRANGFKHVKTISEFVIPNIQRYPYFFHFLLALLPFKLRLKFERISGAFFDTLYLLIFYLIAEYAQQAFNYSSFSYFQELVCVLFAVSPGLLRSGDGPRAFNCSPRIFTLLVYLVHVFSFFAFSQNHKMEYAIVSAIFGGLIFITAIFAIQAMLFFSIFFGLFYAPEYFLFVIGSFILSLIISRGWSIEIIRGVIKHLVNYYSIQEHVLEWYRASLIPYLITAKNKLINLIKVRDFKTFFVWWYIRDNFWLHILITVFPMFLFLPLVIHSMGHSNFDRFLFVFSLAGLTFFLITKHRPFKFLGSGERYLEYAFLPATFIFVKSSMDHNLSIAVFLFILYSISLTPYFLYTYIKENRYWDSCQKELREIFDYSKENFKGIFAPLNTDDSKLINFYSEHRVLVYPTLRDKELFSDKEFAFIYGESPKGYIYGNIKAIFEKYNCSYLFVQKSQLEEYSNIHFENSEAIKTLFKPVYDTEHFQILKFSLQ